MPFNPEDRWWQPRRPDEPVTANFLGRVLDELGADELARRAREAHFDDYFAPPEVASGMELMNLVESLQGWKRRRGPEDRRRTDAVIAAVKAGEFDGTHDESKRWEESAGGQRAMAELPPRVRKALFGEGS